MLPVLSLSKEIQWKSTHNKSRRFKIPETCRTLKPVTCSFMTWQMSFPRLGILTWEMLWLWQYGPWRALENKSDPYTYSDIFRKFSSFVHYQNYRALLSFSWISLFAFARESRFLQWGWQSLAWHSYVAFGQLLHKTSKMAYLCRTRLMQDLCPGN